MKNHILAPSMLSADFGILAEQIKLLENSGVKYLHIDVMDGAFVPNISIGIPVVKSLRKYTDMVFDVHLMILSPEKYIEQFAKAGADIINIHYEACNCCEETLKRIRELGKSPAITIKPKTSWKEIIPFLPLVDMVLVMSVEPGFGGQSFIPSCTENLDGLSAYAKENGLNYNIEIDGGINRETVFTAVEHGANIIVAGSAVFGATDIYEEAKWYNETLSKYEK